AAPVVQRAAGTPLLEVTGLVCSYRSARGRRVVDDVGLTIGPGETVALVGESGSGKSTALRAIAGLHEPDAGSIGFAGTPLARRVTSRSRELRRQVQIVFQDPHASLNPRHTVGEIIDRPLALFQPQLSRQGRRARIVELLEDVRLDG